MKKTLTIATALMCLAGGTVHAQDIHFSQFYENAILRNPGLTGIFSGDYKAGINYRTQWGNISNPFQTVLASVESRVLVNKEQHDYLSFGLCMSHDQAGSISFNSLQITPAVNYNKSLNDAHASYLSLGFAGSYIQRSVDASKMTFDNQYIGGGYVASAPSNDMKEFKNISHYDVSAGVSFNSTMGENNQIVYYIGGSAYHITKPKESFNQSDAFIRLSPRFTGNFGLTARITSRIGLTVLANYTNQDPYQETMLGGLVSWRNTKADQGSNFAIYAGLFMRYKDALIPTMKVDYKKYSFTLSYDVTTSSLKPALSSKGGWEMSIYVRGKYKKNEGYVDKVMCPSFEQSMQTPFDME
jgi:type IX secretion system PorP/SprF family membrane protein